jgi:endonuclease/exonuclease/phosphatase (EEP) superfamily protein YafD
MDRTVVAMCGAHVALPRILGLVVLLVGDFNANGRAAIDPIDTLTRGGLNIDWVLTSPAFVCRSLATRDDPATDHRAVIVELELPGGLPTAIEPRGLARR